MKTKGAVSRQRHVMYCHQCSNEFIAKDTKAKWCSEKCKSVVNHKPNQRKYYLKQAFGLTEVEYHQMYTKQKGLCWICQKPYPKLWIDHNHETGDIRGLLCNRCNTALGMFNESFDCLDRAKEYLEVFKAVRC